MKNGYTCMHIDDLSMHIYIRTREAWTWVPATPCIENDLLL